MTGKKDQPEELSIEDLDGISGGPNRRAHDHVGNFNFIDAEEKDKFSKLEESRKNIIAEAGSGNGSI